MNKTIYFNCTVYTGDPDGLRTEYIGVEDGLILETGTRQDLELDRPGTQYIDFNGAFVLPGFNDSHLHLSTLGANLYDLDLTGTGSIAELKERLAHYIRDNKIPEGEWVLGKGWNQDYFKEGRLPSRYDLDQVSPRHKVCLIRGCYHLCVVNSETIKDLGLTGESQVESGVFDVDPDSKELTGICRENAMKYVLGNLPRITPEKFRKYVLRAQDYLLSLGVTSAQTDDFMLAGVEWPDVIKVYLEMAERDELKLRVFEQCLLPSLKDLREFLDKGYTSFWGEKNFQISCLKLLVDGNFGNGTAALIDPFEGEPDNRGIMNYTAEELEKLFGLAYKNGLRIGVHCIGDRAAEMALEAERKTAALYNGPTRLNLIHCQMAGPKILKDMRELGVVGNIQPAFLDYDIHMAESKIGPERIKHAYNWKTMLNEGIALAMGTDSPVTIPDPLMEIYCAVARKDFSGFPQGGWYPEEGLTVREAIDAYTKGSAYSCFMEEKLGMVKPGMAADLTVLDKDPFICGESQLQSVRVLRTIVAGNTVYQAKEQ